MKNINIIVIGCTGLVGNVFIKLLKNIKLDYNVKYFLEQCINSIKIASKGLKVEIFVVDNNSKDGSSEMIKKKLRS